MLQGEMGFFPTPVESDVPLVGYIKDVPPESKAEADARHRRMEKKRNGQIVLVHRGATAFAPENSFESFVKAMDYGGDGVEFDLRKTADGVLVVFHDRTFTRLMESAWGTIRELTYYDLIQIEYKDVFGMGARGLRIPTFAALLNLARQRDMVFELDCKELDIGDDAAEMIEKADMWDHFIAMVYSIPNGPDTLSQVKHLPLGTVLYEGRGDMDPKFVAGNLPKPGTFTMVEDPRVTAKAMGRPAYAPVAPPADNYQYYYPSSDGAGYDPNNFMLSPFVKRLVKRVNPFSVTELVALLKEGLDERMSLAADYTGRTERLIARAWAAERLGKTGAKSAEVVSLLEDQVRNAAVNEYDLFHGLDGVCAAEALGKIGAGNSASAVIEALDNMDRVSSVTGIESDVSFKCRAVERLGYFRSKAAKEYLKDILRMGGRKGDIEVHDIPQRIAKTLLMHDLDSDELVEIMKHPNPNVAAVALEHCLDRPTSACNEALRREAPWALDLVRTYRC